MALIRTVLGRSPSIATTAFVADDATIAGDVTLSAGVSVWFGCVVRSERSSILVGDDTNIQDLSVVHTDAGHPVRIGERVTVGHRVVLHGCTVEDDALIGMGAVVMNGATIGAAAVVGAGAVVTESTTIPAGSMALGVPAKVVELPVPPVPRPNVASYLELADHYRRAR